MSVLSDVNTTLGPIGIPLETGAFTGIAPDKYIVVIPLVDSFGLNADNSPSYDIQEARISLYSKSNYIADKNHIIRTLLAADFTITGRQYIGYETGTGYHHYVVDVAKHYEMEE